MSALHGRALGSSPRCSPSTWAARPRRARSSADGQPLKKYELEVARVHEFKKGSGLPVQDPRHRHDRDRRGRRQHRAPRRARRDRASARAARARSPAPPATAAAATTPTLTDANLRARLPRPGVLPRRQDAARRDGARRARSSASWRRRSGSTLDARRLGHPRGRQRGRGARLPRARLGARRSTTARCSMIAFGGSGPLHAARIARKLRIPRVVFPAGAGVMSAFGLLVSPSPSRSCAPQRVLAPTSTPAEFAAMFERARRGGRAYLASAGVGRDAITHRCAASTCATSARATRSRSPLPDDVSPADAFARLPELFEQNYARIFTTELRWTAARDRELEGATVGPTPRPAGRAIASPASAARWPAGRSRDRVARFVPERDGTSSTARSTTATRCVAGRPSTGPALVEEKRVHLRHRRRRPRRVDAQQTWSPRSRPSLKRGPCAASTRSSLGIMWDRLISIADEIVSALIRTSFSLSVREVCDLSCVLFDATGRSLAQGTLQPARRSPARRRRP